MKIDILGIGIMGSIMSEAVLKAGYDLIVYNRTIEKTKPFADIGARVAKTPAQVICEADVSIIVVMGGDAIKEIMLSPDVLAAVKNKTIICASSCNVDEMMAVNEAVIEHGGRFAEITMGSTSANHSVENLYFELGCPAEDETFLVETLSPMCEEIQRFGEVGYLAKLGCLGSVGNLISLINIAYCTALAQRLGIPSEDYEPTIREMDPIAGYFIDKMSAHDYNDVVAHIEHYLDSAREALTLLKENNLPTEPLMPMLKLLEVAADEYPKKDGACVVEILLNDKI